MTTNQISQKDYEKAFHGREKVALEHALDIRKFEIELYWKRATYFWTFIGATLAGFVAVQNFDGSTRQNMSVILSSLGLVFSFSWVLVNRGSKFWQENWEKHVDMLEDKITGPLYKIVLSRNSETKTDDSMSHLLSGASEISVSKINQIVSVYIFVLWWFLMGYSLWPMSLDLPPNYFYIAIVALTVICCGMFIFKGTRYKGSYINHATQRTAEIQVDKVDKMSGDKVVAD
ncbi:hypothetical protein [Shewanella sp. GutDb-MelDb]|uniref:RipA family octameric membrane protein n=1 Tax=Shewanella sp. GutDb-MelDb TaxID=2058316 RepID=UPI000C7AB29A|nr:hypothetical protein [Shewanella sp. GutDb-MelDb]PKG56339.1 hypothetical protein CXF82_15360 [Shewanella sp. GutDb-MelDb]